MVSPGPHQRIDLHHIPTPHISRSLRPRSRRLVQAAQQPGLSLGSAGFSPPAHARETHIFVPPASGLPTDSAYDYITSYLCTAGCASHYHYEWRALLRCYEEGACLWHDVDLVYLGDVLRSSGHWGARAIDLGCLVDGIWDCLRICQFEKNPLN